MIVSSFGSTILVPVSDLDPKQYFADKSNGVVNPKSAFAVEIGIVFWLEQMPEQLMAVDISDLLVPELIPLVSCTFPKTGDVSCLISEGSVTMLIALSRIWDLKIQFSGSELSQIFKILSQNPDVATKRSLDPLPLRLLYISFPGATCRLTK